MSAAGPEHRQARLHIGADPHHLPADVVAHVAGCADCRRFRDETLALDSRVHAALELPLNRFRQKAPPARRFALAASVVLALVVGGGFWLFRPSTALAGDVVQHVVEEADSWNMHQQLPPAQVADVLRVAGAQFDSPFPVVYGYPCPFKGHRVAHLVVQTPNGTMTVMLIPHEQVRRRTQFSRAGMSGVLVPAGQGSVALLTRDGEVPEALADEIVSRVRW
jgi:uncharacterized protein DUF3379